MFDGLGWAEMHSPQRAGVDANRRAGLWKRKTKALSVFTVEAVGTQGKGTVCGHRGGVETQGKGHCL